MTIEVHAAIIHHLHKDRDQPATIEYATGVLNHDDALSTLIDGVLGFFDSGRSILYGEFEEDTDTYPVSSWIREYREGNIDLVQLSRQITDRLVALITNERWATGGYLLFCDYTDDAGPGFTLSMLDNVDGVRIEDDTLALKLTQHLEINRLRQAVRLGLTAMEQDGGEDYLAFVRQNRANDVAQYFFSAIGCLEYKDVNRITKRVIKNLNKYLSENGVDLETKARVLQSVYERMDRAHRDDVRMTTAELSNAIAAIVDADMTFKETIEARHWVIPEDFRVGSNYIKLQRYSGRGRSYSVWFQHNAMTDGTVEVDLSAGTITINEIPESIRDRLGGDGDGD